MNKDLQKSKSLKTMSRATVNLTQTESLDEVIWKQVIEWGVQQELLSVSGKEKLVKEYGRRKRIEIKKLRKSSNLAKSTITANDDKKITTKAGGNNDNNRLSLSTKDVKKNIKSPRSKQPEESVKQPIESAAPENKKEKKPPKALKESPDAGGVPPIVPRTKKDKKNEAKSKVVEENVEPPTTPAKHKKTKEKRGESVVAVIQTTSPEPAIIENVVTPVIEDKASSAENSSNMENSDEEPKEKKSDKVEEHVEQHQKKKKKKHKNSRAIEPIDPKFTIPLDIWALVFRYLRLKYSWR